MSERPRQQQRPNLEHRASQTIIDLTDDVDMMPVRHSPSILIQRPARSSHISTPPVAGAAVIDLTDDAPEDDLQITGVIPRLRRERAEHHDHDPFHALLHNVDPPRADSPFFVPEAPRQRQGIPILGHMGHLMAHLGRVGRVGFLYPHHQDRNEQVAADEPFLQGVNIIRLPNQLNYAGRAFGAGGNAPAPRPDNKPEHMPPIAAPEGFTSSPTEEDTLICPACEQELVTNVADEPYQKGKGRTKKDRADHPFWVVKLCGHVSPLTPLTQSTLNAQLISLGVL